LANIPVIIMKGGTWFSGIGTETSKGTKVFAVTGKVKNSGLVEVPMGTAIEDIVYGICGGALSGKNVKAIQTGGPSGGVIPKEFFQTKVDYESLQKMGSIMGSGGMIVMDEDDCMADIAKFYLGFCVDESCGKCAPCRIGGTQMLRLLRKVTDGEGTQKDLEQLEQISFAMQKASLCGLGQTAPNPVLSTLHYYRAEYDAHVNKKKCPACKCAKLVRFLIMSEKCVKCGMCFKACPVNAISGNRESGYLIDQTKCIRCGQCFEVCKPRAISRS
jgi:NADH:ubiquinone oxidoreductase subunit F (NADH-binding)/Pyruvate/2-oxoacid:ferredoxin oxidoreductase delta subunit